MTNFWRGVFWLALVFNVLAGSPLLLAPDFMLVQLGASVPSDLVFHRLAGLLVMALGAIYGFVASDLQRYRPLVWVAIVAKLGVGAMFIQAWIQGLAPVRAVALAGGDIAFGLIFLAFMLTYPKQA